MLFRPMEAWDPFAELYTQMSRLADDWFGGQRSWRTAAQRGFPPVSAWEDDGNLYVEAELPGLQLEDIDISVLGNELILKGQRRETSAEDQTYHLQERANAEFRRVLALPVEVDAGKVSATLKNGVLTITLPKAATARPRKIPVKVE